MASTAKVLDITIRSILIILLLLVIAASGSTIGYGTFFSSALGSGGWLLSISILGLIYEIVMLALSAQKDPTIVLVDIILSSLFAFGFAIGSIAITVIAATTFDFFFFNFPHTPAFIAAGFGYLCIIGFIGSAITSGRIRHQGFSEPQSQSGTNPPPAASVVVVTQAPQAAGQYPVQAQGYNTAPTVAPPYGGYPGTYPVGGTVQAPVTGGFYPQPPLPQPSGYPGPHPGGYGGQPPPTQPTNYPQPLPTGY